LLRLHACGLIADADWCRTQQTDEEANDECYRQNQIVLYADAEPLAAKLLKNGTWKIYDGFPHGMPTTGANTINADLLEFAKDVATSAA
jgi:hypothetical protein